MVMSDGRGVMSGVDLMVLCKVFWKARLVLIWNLFSALGRGNVKALAICANPGEGQK